MMVGTVTVKLHSSILIKQGDLPRAVDGRLCSVFVDILKTGGNGQEISIKSN